MDRSKTLQAKLNYIFENYPDKVAIDYKDKKICYGELAQRSNYIANWILAQGISQESSIGIFVVDKVELITLIIGILKARCIFVPLEPNYPLKRTQVMISTAECRYIFTDQETWLQARELTAENNLQQVCIDEDFYLANPDWYQEIGHLGYTPADKIYIYFTSGTTGVPKAILGNNKGLHHFIHWEIDEFELTETTKVSQLTSPCHDPFLRDIFIPLCIGGTVCVPNSKETILDSARLINWIEQSGVNLIHCTPSLFTLFNSPTLHSESFSKLKYVLLAGERVIPKELQNWYNIFADRIQLVNAYGPTETTLFKLFYRISVEDVEKSNIPIGKPIKGAKAIILNEDMEICGPGKVGFIYIRTPFRTYGYFNNPKLTEQKFIPNPFNQDPNDLIYRTGDLGRLLLDGNIEFIGRADRQIKIRGIRVELSEIENLLLSHQLVKTAYVLNREIKERNNVLVAYIVSNGDVDTKVSIFRDYLAQKLPDYMLPQHFILLDHLPLNLNGKVDQNLLPESDIISRANYIPPRNDVEAKLAKIWSEVLEIDEISMDARFFDIGGHSLNAMKLISLIYQEYNVNVPLAKILKNPSIEILARYIQAESPTSFAAIEKAEEKEFYSVSSAQKRMYILHQLADQSTHYNTSFVIQIDGKIDQGRFETAFKTLIGRHEAFRTSFVMVDGEIKQKIFDDVDFKLEYLEVDEENVEMVVPSLVKPFDMKRPPLIWAGLIQVNEEKHILAVDMHHIISDGVSKGILMKEFARLYNGEELSDLQIQYKDFSEWQNKFFESAECQKQAEYWQETQKGDIPVLEMPLDYERPKRRSYVGEVLPFTLSAEITSQLDKFAKEKDVTLNTLLLALYSLLLNKYTDQQELVIGSLVAGRKHIDLYNVIGMFANFLPIKVKVDENSIFSEFLDSIRESVVAAYANQDYPFEKIVEDLDLPTDHSRNLLFDTMLIFHNQIEMDVKLEVAGLKFTEYLMQKDTTTLDLKLDMHLNHAGEMNCYLQYDTELFKEETMYQLIEKFKKLVTECITNPAQSLTAIQIFSAEEKEELIEKRTGHCQPQEKLIQVAVAATFVAEPIKPYISWWGKQVNLNLDIKFSPYHQVFQELLDPSSIISRNQGVNLLLVRFEDFIRNDYGSDLEKCAKLKNVFAELIQIISTKEKTAIYFAGIFPVSEHLEYSSQVMSCLRDLNQRWQEAVSKISNLHLIDFRVLQDLYGIEEIFDWIKDREGHIPFSDEFYAAMGQWITRKIFSLNNQKYKVIVLDCDNTLWKGICGEDGVNGIQMEEPYAELQQFMLQKYNEGLLLCLCSKNNETDVLEVFEKNPQMILKKENFISWRINWNAKSQNLCELAAELNLGIDSFIFIDDSPVECAEVMANCPEVLTMQLPDAEEIPLFLAHTWEFDRVHVTVEDQKRNQMYRSEKARQVVQQQCGSLEDFIQTLDLQVQIHLVTPDQLSRMSQLTMRTNQFNLSTIRRSEADLSKLQEKDGVNCWAIEVTDRFGDYGLVGVVITIEENHTLFLETFLLSCRVLGRRVEDRIIKYFQEYGRKQQLSTLVTRYYPTAKNLQIKEFLLRTNWEKTAETVEYIEFQNNVC
ncbi:MAG: amino acid adenylation domain-containing protein [Halanaerobiales bacterium]|nr:amino acid adenylation domain-containing protein [Halanaerobiales bacterium]